MASPFRVFRKNQKLMLALLTLVAMVGFVIGDIITSISGGQAQGPGAVVVTTERYGDLTESELQSIRNDRQKMLQFIQGLSSELVRPLQDAYRDAAAARERADQARTRAAGLAGGADASVEVQNLQKTADDLQKAADDLNTKMSQKVNFTNQRLEQISRQFGATDEESLVNAWLLARRGEEMGLVVGDTAINAFIESLMKDPYTGEAVISAAQVQQSLDAMKMSVNELFRILERELLSLRVREMFFASVEPSTPAQRWDYYRRLNRKAVVEVAPVPVKNFIDKVPAPTEADLRAYFDRYANRLPDPSSPEPGFKIPVKVALEYFKGEYSKIVDPASVAAEDVKKYYEEHKDDYYKRAELPKDDSSPAADLDPGLGSLPGLNNPALVPDEPSGAAAEAAAKTPAKPGAAEAEPAPATPDTDKPSAAAEGKPAATVDEAKPAQPQDKPGRKAPTDPAGKSEGKKPNAERGDTKPAEKDTGKSDSAKGEPKPKDGAAVRGPSPFRLVAWQDGDKPSDAPQAEAKPAGKTEAGKTEAGKKAAAESKSQSKPQPAAEKEPSKPGEPAEAASDTSGDKPAAAASTTPPAAAEAAKDAGQNPAAAEAAKPPVTQYIPLAEVEGEIRDRLARTRAEEVINQIRMEVSDYASKLNLYELEQEDSAVTSKAAPPVPPDFRGIAAKHHMTFHTTGPMSAAEMRSLDIAEASVGSQDAVPYVFEQLAEFRPEVGQDTAGNYYLFWTFQKNPARVPKFEEVRSQVLESYKAIQARELAVKQAQALAEEARKSKKPLREALAGKPGVPVLESEPFSWLTSNSFAYYGPQMPTISEVRRKPTEGTTPSGDPAATNAVAMPGDDFMRTVFSLEPGGIGVALNQPRNEAYVVRVVEFNPADAVLQAPFFKGDSSTYQMVGFEDIRALSQGWTERLEREAGLKWQREPYRPTREQG